MSGTLILFMALSFVRFYLVHSPALPHRVRKHGLQDAKKRTLINADENLNAVFNGKAGQHV